jgi:hypothetical protein
VEKRRLSPGLLAAIVAGHLILTSFIWRDIRNRSDDQVRGSKRLWRFATGVNSANSIAYLLFGRRRVDRPTGA